MSRKCSAPTFSREDFAMMLQRKSVRHFQRRPKFVIRAGRDRVGRTQNDVAGKRIVLKHVIEGGSIFSGATFQATSAPSARLVASRVWRTRRIVPARNMAAMRAITTSLVRPERRAISSNGSRTKPSILSSEIARILALIGSLCSTGQHAAL